ncbi:beta-galactosidase [Xylanimonas protaetiae]|uniref:Beta-galactosidase n=1 Tax=Xylanimonas protaetiae TaxID=2509457 RepID=A0A4P6F339_9MICO|nr:beta-galactosidase [Xylanimonas protaetiae]QAY70270.1 beta-galactosidase [Xylanimonas protaetiae]
MRNDTLAYGGDYNPEQWDDATLEQDVKLMREAGVTVVSLGIFSWALLEPEEGRFEVGWLRAVVDRLHAAGIGVDLATATASPPAWLGRRYPETLPVTREGAVLRWGSRQAYNPSSQVFRDRVAALVEVLAAEFSGHPALVAWHVGNEYACHVLESFDDETAGRFRAWVRARYGTLDAVNEAWGTAFWSQRVGSWDDVIPPGLTPTFGNPHQVTDWKEFCSDTLLELYLLEKEILNRANPAIPVTTNFMGLFEPLDYRRWAQHVDFVSNDTYPDPADPRGARTYALDADLMRSLGGGRPFVQMEQAPNAVQWRARNAAKRPGQYALWSLQTVARGADGILDFQWRQSTAGAETWHSGMVPHAGREARTWRDVVALGQDLATAGAVRGGEIDVDVAILWDWRNAWTQDAAIGPVAEKTAVRGLRDWHASLFERGHVVDVAHPEDDLTGYRVVVVPSLFRLTDAAAARLREAVAAGVHVVVTYLTGYVDAAGHAVLGGYLRALADVVGVRVLEFAPFGVSVDLPGSGDPLDPEVDRVSAEVGAPGADDVVELVEAEGAPFRGAAREWADDLAVDDERVRVVARFAGTDLVGGPAVTVLPGAGGAGDAWYVATRLDARGRDTVLGQVLAAAGVVEHAVPPGVSRTRRGPVTFLLNHGDSPAVVAAVTGRRLDTGEELDAADVVVGPRSAVLVQDR